MIELKPCPFCGGEVKIFKNYLNQNGISCTRCDGVFWFDDNSNEKNLKEAWNRRVESDR